jgi:hypothetical protein
MRLARRTTLLTATVALAAVSPASGATSKLYMTSSRRRCPSRSGRRFGWLNFKARITSARYTTRRDTTGEWGIDLGEEPELFPPQPGPPRTKLTEAAVKRLAPGERVRVSGTIVISYDDDTGPPVDQHDRGRERFKYALTVRRVR